MKEGLPRVGLMLQGISDRRKGKFLQPERGSTEPGKGFPSAKNDALDALHPGAIIALQLLVEILVPDEATDPPPRRRAFSRGPERPAGAGTRYCNTLFLLPFLSMIYVDIFIESIASRPGR